ncbi:MAG: ABC transporter ATP-binding protein [Alphaproteobacteria bacterium]|nr:ABC transporter ATP-binding protein [Alphaproteobacteria bacterium]
MIVVENLTKIFESKTERVAAVDGVGFTVEAGEMVTLLGPSGCGKTTTLRCVAGLERPNGGRIQVDGAPVVDCGAKTFVPPHLRNLGMVFQSYAIWPHMTVFDNVAYALEGKKLGRAEIKKRTEAALDLVQLAGFADRPAPRLSGGQQQRVAIARALAGSPCALLFDEPLSNLDAKLRSEMRSELRRLQQQVGLTSIYVTHDQSEALAISDWIIVMRAGRIVERGRPTEIYRAPKNLFTAQFIGNTNLIPGTVTAAAPGGGPVRVETALGPMAGLDPNDDLKVGEAVRLSIRPEDLFIAEPGAAGAENALSGRVRVATFQGSAVEAELAAGEETIQCHFGRDVELAQNAEINLTFDSQSAVVLRDEALDDERDAA